MAAFVGNRSCLFSSAFAIISFYILCLPCISLTEALRGGFSVELIPRDSPKSPLYNPNETPYQRVANAMRRSVKRVNHFLPTSTSPNTAQAEIISNRGEYLVNISIGTPRVEIIAVADTGSDLIWTQCKPCAQCFRQEAPLFDPRKSSTYKDLSCSSTQCASLERTSCEDSSCAYSVAYGDSSFSNGNLAVDTVTLGSTSGRPVVLPKTTFGCGHNNDGTFDSKTSGIVGLGGGEVSLVTQMGASIGGKFSYCLIPLLSSNVQDTTSKLNFGTNGVVSGSGVVSTPLIKKDPDTFYFLNLEAISVGSKRIPFTGSSFGSSDGNIIIDSGTTLTILPQDFNTKLVEAVSSSIDAEPVADPTGLLDLCYSASSDFNPPNITVNFDGANVRLKPFNVFIAVTEDVVCLTFKGGEDVAIYGNLVQTNFLVGYDTQKQTVSFKPTDCTKE